MSAGTVRHLYVHLPFCAARCGYCDFVTLVGRREGRFKAIRLHARGADVELRSVRVIYTNGQPDDLPTRHFLRQGGYTPPLDLRGWERAIDRVDMVYKTVPNFKGIATVCVEGLQ